MRYLLDCARVTLECILGRCVLDTPLSHLYVWKRWRPAIAQSVSWQASQDSSFTSSQMTTELTPALIPSWIDMPGWLQCLTNHPCNHCATGIHIHISPFYRERTLESFWFTRHPFRKNYEKITARKKKMNASLSTTQSSFFYTAREKK